MDKNRASMLKITTLALALSLVGCGGGGSSDAPGPTTSAARTVSGTAAKGILKGATVKVFAIAADGTQGSTAIVTGTTGFDGTFSLSIPADVLSFIVEVSGGPNALTVDEATGQDVPISATFKLHSVVKLASGAAGTYTGSVSPLTEMIVQTALAASGGLSDANINSAKTGFAAFFGFDPEKVVPVNSNGSGAAAASADEKLQSVLLAAISKMAKDGKLGCATGTDGEKLACVVVGVGKLAKIKGTSLELDDSLSGAIDTAATEVLADTTINKTGNTTILPLPKGSVPIVPPAANGLLAAKALFASLRSNLTALSNAGNTGVLDIRADAMRADFDQATAPLDQDLGKWMQLTTNGIDFLRAYQAGTNQANTLEVYAGGTKIGGCSVYSDVANNTPATAAGNAVGVGCSVIRKNVPGSQTFGLTPNTYKRVTAAFTIVPASDTTYTYKAQARLETWVVGASERNPNLDVTLGNYGAPGSRATGTISYVKSGDTVSNLVVNGSMPARTNEFGVALTDRETWSLSASRSAEGGNLYKYAFSGAIASIRNDVEVGKVSIADGSFVRTEESLAGHVLSGGVRELSLGLAAEAGGSKVAGTLTMAKAMADKGGNDYMPTDVSFTGSLSTAGAEFFSGTLHFTQTGYAQFDSTLPESASNFVAKNATLVGKLSIKDRPTLGLSLSASNTAFHNSSLTGQYNDGSSLINFSVSDNGAAKVTQISSADGVSVSVKDGSETVEVTKGGVKVALLNTKSGHIDYADGSFESLK